MIRREYFTKEWAYRNRTAIILFFVLVAGFLIRLPNLSWGVPMFDRFQRIFDGDEPKLLQAAFMFPPKLSVFPHPTVYHYLLGLLSWPVKVIIPYTDPKTFLFSYFSVFLYIRIITVFFGTASIYMTFLTGRKLYGRDEGLLAAAFVAFSMIHMLYSSMAIIYVPLAFFITLGFYKLFDLEKDQRLGRYIQLGLVTGLIMGTKYTGFLFLIPLGIYLLLVQRKIDQGLSPARNAAVCLAVACAVLVISTPTLLFKETWHMFRVELKELDAFSGSLLDLNLWKLNFRYLTDGVGLPLGLMYVFGLMYPVRKRLREGVMLVLIICFYAYFRHGMMSKYTIPLIPLFALFSSHAVMTICRKDIAKLLKTAIFALVAIVIGYSLIYSAGAVCLRLNDTRPRAARYIEENIPAGTTIGIAYISEKYPWRYHGYRYPYVDFKKYREVHFLDDPEYIVVSSVDLDQFKGRKSTAGYWYRFTPPTEKTFKFFKDILAGTREKYVLIESFEKVNDIPIDMPPPEIRLYHRVERE